MGLSILELILEMQSDFYKKYNKAVSVLFINTEKLKYLLRELEVDSLDNLHGMKIIVTSTRKITLC